MAGKTLIYLDPGFRVDFGHFTRVGELIREEAEASKVKLMHFVNLDVPQEKADELGLIRRFKYIADYPDFHRKLDGILQEAVKKENQIALEVFMYTAYPLHLPLIAFLLSKYSDKIHSLSAHICIFNIDPKFCIGDDVTGEYKSMLKKVSRLIELFDPGRLLTVCTDSERTARVYGPYFERELKVLPVPIESTLRVSPERKADVEKEITIGYIAQATRRAGDALVYHAYKNISKMKVFDKIRFKIKHSPHDYFKEQSMKIHEQFLSESQNINHIHGFLSNEEYEQFLDDCNIILVPYSRRHYYCKTSGIVVEALLKNRIVVVPEDTWMSDQIRDYGSGETFISDDVESFVQAVIKVVSNFEYYKKRTGKNIEEYRELHSCSNLFTEIGLKDKRLKVEGKTDQVKMEPSSSTLEELLIENVVLMQGKDVLTRQIRNKDTQIKNRDARIHTIKDSWSWKVTAPLRRVTGWKSRVKKNDN